MREEVRGKAAEFLVDDRQQFVGGLGVALLDGAQDAGDVTHGLSPSLSTTLMCGHAPFRRSTPYRNRPFPAGETKSVHGNALRNRHVKSALLHVISLARLACVHTWAWAAGSLDTRTRLAAQLQQAQAEIALLREELRIKDARMAQIAAHRRPHYPPTERMAILELRAARGWNWPSRSRRDAGI